MRTNKLQLLLIIGIAFLLGFFVGTQKVSFDWKNYKPQVSIVNKEPPSSLSTVDMSQFWDVWNRLDALYYNKQVLDPQKMLNGAITGMVQSLGDPFTMYLPPVQNNDFQQQLAGKFEGIGAELGLKDKQIVVIAPLDGSPAQKAGIKAGDEIVKVGDASTQGWSLQQAVEKIRGPKGSQVILGIIHKGSTETASISITRDTITVKSVLGWIKSVKDIDNLSDQFKQQFGNQKVMYVQLSQFGDSTNQDWTALITQLSKELKQQPDVKGMILDLRNNPGGYLTDATFIAGEFLPQGKAVVTEDAGNGQTTTLSVTRDGQLLQIPLIVLINGGSASASEIVAGALHDYGRATLVGDQSYGKGTVQQALDLGQGAGLHVTIAKWLTPKGTWVNGKGLTPDVKVALDPKNPLEDLQLESGIKELLK